MALVRCVSTHSGFVLNTFYCKCAKNIKNCMRNNSYKTEDLSQSKPVVTFSDLMNFRQLQAKRSVLVNIGNEKHYKEFLNICSSYGKVLNAFRYNVKNNEKYLLVELQSISEVQMIKTVTVNIQTKKDIYAKSNLLSYKNNSYLSTSKESTNTIYKTWNSWDIKDMLQKHKSVSMQMTALYNTLKMTELDIRLRFYVAHQTAIYIKKLFHNIDVIPFGSSVNGFGQRGCDLDLLCIPYENHNQTMHNRLHFMSQPINIENVVKQKQFLETIGTIMGMCIPEIGNVKKILQARVPIIKFCYLATDTECDFSNTIDKSALDMSKALYTYGLIDWRIKPLVSTIRTWAKSMLITKNTPGSWITNHSLTLLVLFYLQVEKIIPSLDIIEYHDEKLSIKNKITYSTNKIMQNKAESLHHLLFGFFAFYNSFNFSHSAICIREARIKKKLRASPVYIYNPYDNRLNVAQNINENELAHMKDHIKKACNTLGTHDSSIIDLLGLSDLDKTIHHSSKVDTHNDMSNKVQSNDIIINKKFIANESNVDTLRTEEKV